jgi:hypothetical protein
LISRIQRSPEVDCGRQRRLNESRVRRLYADRRGLFTLKRHAENSATKVDSNWHRLNRSDREKLEPFRIRTPLPA